MWPRTVEIMLACWLAISPFVFRHPDGEPALWWNDWACATLVALFGLFSFIGTTRRTHLLTLLVAAWLIGYGWATSSGEHPAPAKQNDIVVGLLLLMLALIPSECTKPPVAWREWNRSRGLGPEGQPAGS